MNIKIALSPEAINNNIEEYVTLIKPVYQHAYLERFASFDYCFNYFQSFYRSDKIKDIASVNNIEKSTLQLGQYLASWGMFRGSTALLRHSSHSLLPVIECIANTHPTEWEIDINNYNESIGRLTSLYVKIGNAIEFPIIKEGGVQQRPSPILITKIMLGIFGNTPAFDTYFMKGINQSVFINDGFEKSLNKVIKIWNALYDLYTENKEVFENDKIETLDFHRQTNTDIYYTNAKIADMAFFIEGKRKIDLEKAKKL